MKKLAVILLLLTHITVAAQVKTNSQDSLAADKIVKQLIGFYNNDEFSAIHKMLSDEFRQSTSESNTITFYRANLKSPLGKINNYHYAGAGKRGILFMVDFERSKLSLEIMLNTSNQISGILWLPFENKKLIPGPRDPKSIQTNNPRKTPLQIKIDAVAMNYLKDPNNSSLSIGIVDKDKTELFFYGETKKGTHELPTSSSLYEIASISKTFTAILLARAVNEGKIKLNDDIRKYLPGDFNQLQFKGSPIKIINLSNHTSGLPSLPDDFDKQQGFDPANPYLHYPKEGIYAFLRKFKPDTIPGSVSVYSNLGFAVLGTILENVYQMPLEQLLQKNITGPLKMLNTHYEVAAAQDKFMVTGYSDETGKAVSYWNLENFKAAGGLKSTVSDMLLYLKANINEINADYSLSHQPTDQQEDFERGLAWMIQPLDNDTVVWHNGGTAGFRSYCGFIPGKKAGVIVLSNSSASVDEAGLELLRDIIYSAVPQK